MTEESKPSQTSDWYVRKEQPVDTSERYSQYVKLMRIALPVTALIITLIVVVYAMVVRPNTQVALTFSGVDQFEGDLSMTNPRFTGLDAESRFFDVTASVARRDDENSDMVALENVTAAITHEGEEFLSVTAEHGSIDASVGALELGPNVQITLNDGHEFTTEGVRARLKDGIIEGMKPITGFGPIGSFSADSFEVSKEDRSFKLVGRVRMRLDTSYLLDKKADGDETETSSDDLTPPAITSDTNMETN